jgi:hypothetical protein
MVWMSILCLTQHVGTFWTKSENYRVYYFSQIAWFLGGLVLLKVCITVIDHHYKSVYILCHLNRVLFKIGYRNICILHLGKEMTLYAYSYFIHLMFDTLFVCCKYHIRHMYVCICCGYKHVLRTVKYSGLIGSIPGMNTIDSMIHCVILWTKFIRYRINTVTSCSKRMFSKICNDNITHIKCRIQISDFKI